MSITVQDLKKHIVREIELVSEDGVVDEHGNWTSQKDEIHRLERLLNDITYFMREYG